MRSSRLGARRSCRTSRARACAPRCSDGALGRAELGPDRRRVPTAGLLWPRGSRASLRHDLQVSSTEVTPMSRSGRAHRRHLLVVSYFHPPYPGSGNRWHAMARHLRHAGYGVTVVATDAFGRLPDDATAGVVRSRDLRSVDLLRRALSRGVCASCRRSGGASWHAPEQSLRSRRAGRELAALSCFRS